MAEVEVGQGRHRQLERGDILQPVEEVVVELQRVERRQVLQAVRALDQVVARIEPLELRQPAQAFDLLERISVFRLTSDPKPSIFLMLLPCRFR